MREKFSVFEPTAVVLTGTLNLAFEEIVRRRTPYLMGAGLFWIGYALFRLRREKHLWTQWGLGWTHAGPAARECALACLVALPILFLLGTVHPSIHWLFTFIGYLPWAFAQQFLLQAMLSRNLVRMVPSRTLSILLASAVFSLAHWPDLPVMGFTFVAALFLTTVYLRHRTLWPITVAHTLLGTALFYWVLGRDPWVDLFNTSS